jgi:hypothetical protein
MIIKGGGPGRALGGLPASPSAITGQPRHTVAQLAEIDSRMARKAYLVREKDS